MSDLTERLAAKGLPSDEAAMDARGTYQRTAGGMLDAILTAYVADAPRLLPLLLSEPELVAGLAPEVKREVLTPRERAVMKLGEAALNPGVSLDNVAGYFTDIQQFLAALAEARALAPSPAPLEGTNDDR